MLKYYGYFVTCLEVPDEISLAFSISGCQIRCKGCHSQHLWEDVGEELNIHNIIKLIKENKHISCILFMGGEHDLEYMRNLTANLWRILNSYKIKIAWYIGTDLTEEEQKYFLPYCNYVKLGPYIEELGGLDNPNTNQKMFYLKNNYDGIQYTDITYKFRREFGKSET